MLPALIIDHILGNVCFILPTIKQDPLDNKITYNYLNFLLKCSSCILGYRANDLR